MNYNQSLEKAMNDYYGADTFASRIPISNIPVKIKSQTKSKEKQIMTYEQLETMTKQELNLALTPYMGGFADLKHVSKPDMINELLKQHKTTLKPGKKPVSKKSGPGVIETIVEVLEVGKTTKKDILAKLVEVFPEREEKRMINTIAAALSKFKIRFNIHKEKTEDGLFYWIEKR